jgi:hypothetical protein
LDLSPAPPRSASSATRKTPASAAIKSAASGKRAFSIAMVSVSQRHASSDAVHDKLTIASAAAMRWIRWNCGLSEEFMVLLDALMMRGGSGGGKTMRGQRNR